MPEAKAEPTRHVLVTGHSGVGKSTYSEALSKKRKLPIYRLDDDPDFRESVGKWKETGKKPKDHEEVMKRVVDRALKQKVPHIIEGTPLLTDPEQTKGHERILLTRSRRKILQDRLARAKQRLESRGVKWTPEREKYFTESGKDVYKYFSPMVKKFKSAPDVQETKVKAHTRRLKSGKTVRVAEHSREGREKQRKEFAPGIPMDRRIKPIPSAPGMWEFAVQEHHAKRAGKHFDLRLGFGNDAHSWAIPKSLPEPGQVRLAIQQPTHKREYMSYSGVISGRYGAGKVYLKDRRLVEVIESDNNKVVFNKYLGKSAEEFVLLRVKDNKWILVNRSTTKDKYILPRKKPKYKSVPYENNLEELPGDMHPKIDGAHSLLVLDPGKRPRLFSYREGKRGVLEYTHKVPGLYKHRVPPGGKRRIIRCETFLMDKDGSAADAVKTTAILNAGIEKARELQKGTAGLKVYPFDEVNLGKATPSRSVLKELHKQYDFVTPQIIAKTKKEKAKLVNDIQSGSQKLTREGVVLWTDEGPTKAKITDDRDVYIKKVFRGKGKYKDSAGGIFYSRSPNGPVVGKVGGGFSDAFREELWKNRERAAGRVATVTFNKELPSGALFAPRFKRWHPDKDRGEY